MKYYSPRFFPWHFILNTTSLSIFVPSPIECNFKLIRCHLPKTLLSFSPLCVPSFYFIFYLFFLNLTLKVNKEPHGVHLEASAATGEQSAPHFAGVGERKKVWAQHYKHDSPHITPNDLDFQMWKHTIPQVWLWPGGQPIIPACIISVLKRTSECGSITERLSEKMENAESLINQRAAQVLMSLQGKELFSSLSPFLKPHENRQERTTGALEHSWRARHWNGVINFRRLFSESYVAPSSVGSKSCI